MTDVIIAVIPAPGHEGLVAEGPRVPGCTPERPMLVWQCGCGRWGHSGCASLTWTRPQALVLFAPGGPRLGMVRAMEAAFGDDHEAAVVRWDGEHEGWLSDRDGETLYDWPVPQREGLPALGLAAYALAHLLHQRGLASEVLVLPVTS